MFRFASAIAALAVPAAAYRAAVVEHSAYFVDAEPVVSVDEANRVKGVNFAAYVTHAAEAASQGADIIVFPEDGLTGFLNCERDEIYPYLEEYPSAEDSVVPCDQPDKWGPSLVNASCLAQDNALTVVINMGEKVPCSPSADGGADAACPSDGRFQYNTELAFDSQGLLVAKHRKAHLFHEPMYDAAEPALTTFESDFGAGLFALMICYEISFETPSSFMDAAGITNVAFSAWWVNTPPTFSAGQYYQAWSRHHGMNLLASGSEMAPASTFSGSGVYSAGEPLADWVNLGAAADKLLVVDVPELAPAPPASQSQKAWVPPLLAPAGVHQEIECNDTSSRVQAARPPARTQLAAAAPPGQWGMQAVAAVPGTTKTISAKSGTVTCTATFTTGFPKATGPNQIYGVLAYDGWFEDSFYENFCALCRCTSLADCAEFVVDTDTTITYATLSATIDDGMRIYGLAAGDQLELFSADQLLTTDSSVTTAPGFSEKLLNLAILGAADTEP